MSCSCRQHAHPNNISVAARAVKLYGVSGNASVVSRNAVAGVSAHGTTVFMARLVPGLNVVKYSKGLVGSLRLLRRGRRERSGWGG